MKPKISKISIVSMLIILFIISIPVIYAYYFTDWKNEKFFQNTAQRQVIPEFQEGSRIIDNRIVLRKNKSMTVDKNRLVFKGLKNNKIHLDVYFLELDPDYAYPHYISKEDTHKKVRVGDSTFQLLKVSKGALQLRIIDLYNS